MKKLILILSLILSTFVTKASHIMGGMIIVSQTNQDSTAVGLILSFDGDSPLPLASSLSVKMYEMNSVGWYDFNSNITVDFVDTIIHQGEVVALYGSDYLDLDSNKYRFIYDTHCCWPMLSNSSDFSNFVVGTDYWHIPYNSTPYAESPLWVNMEVNSLNSMTTIWGIYNCFFTEPDGDSVNIEPYHLISYYANGVFVPQTSFNQLSNYSVSNDSISWVPTSLGNYGTGFKITEYRNASPIGSQYIQWTFKVVTSTMEIQENIGYRNMEYKVYDWSGKYMGDEFDNLNNGYYIIIYENGITEKIYLKQ